MPEYILVRDKDSRPFLIRKLRVSDTTSLVDFFQGLSKASVDNFHPHPFTKEFVKKMNTRQNLKSMGVKIVLINKGNKKIVGYAFVNRIPFSSKRGYLGVGISDHYQGVGLGSQFTRSLLDFCRNEGICEIYLNVYKNNIAAVKTYKKLGFKISKISNLMRYMILLKELTFNFGYKNMLRELLKAKQKRLPQRNSFWMKTELC